MAVLEQFIQVGKETTYGTAATTGFTAYELMSSDDWAPETNMVLGEGWFSGKHTIREDRTRTDQKGGQGTIQVAVLTNDMEKLLAEFLGSHDATAPVAVSPATTPPTYTQLYRTNTDGPQDSWTVTLGRARVDQTNLDLFTFTGAVVTGGEIACSVDDPLTLTANYAWSDSTSISAVNPTLTYADGDFFTWADIGLSLGGTTVGNCMSFTVSTDLGMQTDRYYMKQSTARDKPIRSAVPSFSGTLEMVYDAAARQAYQAWLGGAAQQLRITAVRGNSTFMISCPAVRLDGSAPVASYDELTTISLPFTVLHDGTNPAIEITYITEGDAYA